MFVEDQFSCHGHGDEHDATNAQIDSSSEQHQGHAHRSDGERTRLDQDIGQILCGEKPIGEAAENDKDRDKENDRCPIEQPDRRFLSIHS